jgi:predicted RNase H-like nuclease
MTTNEQLTSADKRASVVEVHPAVAIWLWYIGAGRRPAEWSYKNIKVEKNSENESKTDFQERSKHIREGRVLAHWNAVCEIANLPKHLPTPTNDDELDAIIAWLLADRWMSGTGVVLLGNQKTGCFLVPKIDGLLEAFSRFMRQSGLQD